MDGKILLTIPNAHMQQKQTSKVSEPSREVQKPKDQQAQIEQKNPAKQPWPRLPFLVEFPALFGQVSTPVIQVVPPPVIQLSNRRPRVGWIVNVAGTWTWFLSSFRSIFSSRPRWMASPAFSSSSRRAHQKKSEKKKRGEQRNVLPSSESGN